MLTIMNDLRKTNFNQPICQTTMRFIKTLMPKTLNRKHDPNMLNMMYFLKIHEGGGGGGRRGTFSKQNFTAKHLQSIKLQVYTVYF